MPPLPAHPVRLPEEPAALVHPWSMAPVSGPAIGIVATEFHARWPWSAGRWAFVMAHMRALCGDAVLIGPSAALLAALQGRSLTAVDTPHPAYRELLVRLRERVRPVARHFDDPGQPCRSFSQFWQRVQRTAR